MLALQGNRSLYFRFLINFVLFALGTYNCFVTFCVCFRLVSIAEETLTEFLSKATGTAVEWIQMPGMKVNNPIILYSFQIFYILF